MIDLYKEEIEAAYIAVEKSSQHDVPIPESWDVDHATAFVRALVTKLLEKEIQDDADLFQCGVDRLAKFVRIAAMSSLNGFVFTVFKPLICVYKLYRPFGNLN